MALTKVGEPKRPVGLRRLLYRLPIALYRLGLGGLLGARFLLLEHTGRKTGRTRTTVVEVVRHDVDAGVYVIASGFGPHAHWYRNIRATPNVHITVGRRGFAATAEPLSDEQGAREMLDYGRRHPAAAKFVARFMGHRMDGSDADLRDLGRRTPFVALHARET